MEENEIKNFVLELMNRTRVVFLTTINGDGLPETRAIDNLRNSDLFPNWSKCFESHDNFLVYISTNSSSEKVKHILKNPIVALYYCIPEEYKGVMIRGHTEIIDDIELKNQVWISNMKIYYPKGAGDHDFTIIQLIPNYIRIYYKLQTHAIDLRDAN
ncbi:MAG: pyridoxamine 5'-phosphate oxidase family protein [Promethearchaeota archaeon]